MKQENKIRALASIALVSVVLAVGVGFFAWHESRENQQLRADRADPFADLTQPFTNGQLQSWDPTADIEAMQKQLRRFQKDFSSDQSFFNKFGEGLSAGQPQIDMQETPKDYKFIVTVPKDQDATVNTKVDGYRLSISGEVKSENHNDNKWAGSSIQSLQRFSQTVYLPDEVDQSRMTTEKKDNKMIITLPKVS